MPPPFQMLKIAYGQQNVHSTMISYRTQRIHYTLVEGKDKGKGTAIPCRPRMALGFQDVWVPRISRQFAHKVVKLTVLRTGCLYPKEDIPGINFFPVTKWIVGAVGLRNSLDPLEESNLSFSPRLKLQFLSQPACSLIIVPPKLSWLWVHNDWNAVSYLMFIGLYIILIVE